MTHRLLLGSGALLSTVVTSLRDRPGRLQVCTTDETLADSLREQSVDVEEFEDIDVDALRSLDTPEIVAVFDQSPKRNRKLARHARSAFQDAQLIAYKGWETDSPEEDEIERRTETAASTGVVLSDELETVAQNVIDPGREVANHIIERVGESGRRMRQLQQVLRRIDRLAVVSHDNPDPDAIASGVALTRLARKAGCQAEVCYYGEITHQENRAFVNILDLNLRNLEPEEDLSEFDGFALVDHSRPGVNDQLPSDTPIDIVIDHHPPRSPVDARFVDLRSNVGATSTLLVDYLDKFNVEFDEAVATALLFGIHVDTQGFSREISEADFTAGAKLVEKANFGMLERIESPSISPQTFATIANAINNRRVEGQTLLSCVGELSERDALAQAADRLLTLEDISIVLVYGIRDGEILISARARGANIDLGEALRDAFGQIGSAGGHVDMAGAQIELGVLHAVEDREESLHQIVEEVVSSRFLDVLSADPDTPLDGRYATEAEIDAEYLVDAPAEQTVSSSDETEEDG